jgi:predicted metal-dependent hydrolase
LAELEEAAAEEAVQQVARRNADIELEAESTVATAIQAIEEEVEGFIRINAPPVTLPTGIAGAILDARERHAVAIGARQAAQAKVEGLERRRQALRSERAGIVSRRAQGAHREDDGQRLELLAADLEGLTDLIERETAKMPAPPDKLREAVEHYEQQWRAAVREARTSTLLAVVHQLESRLMETATHLNRVAPVGVTGGRWKPSIQLQSGVRTGIWNG